ncbi:MAG: LysR family transcriptional regulator [Rhodobacteraceae bacterium]|nr:LysR family transcriptional regulator [Paracoccaceae bacterium]
MDWSLIPSLSALRAFEAAARRGSFSAAARELNVTHAAIAQHVRGLEAEFATTLMIRSGQGMAATDTGAALARGWPKGSARSPPRSARRAGPICRARCG